MAATMYCLPPIVDSSIDVRLPACMYTMEPVNKVSFSTKHNDSVSQERQRGCDSTGLAELETRQEQLLERLADLRTLVEVSRQQLGLSDVGETTSVTVAAPEDMGELVVLADPSCPPLSVLALRALLPSLGCTSHVHSSQPAVADDLLQQFSWRAAAQPSVQLRLIWRPVSQTRLLVSPGGQVCPLAGEEQLCRYVGRTLLPGQYEGGDLEQAAIVDQLLDAAEALRHGAGKERQVALKSLQTTLTGSKFLLGERLTLVDGPVWSALRASGLQTPPAVTAWSERIDSAVKLDVRAVTAAARASVAPVECKAKVAPLAKATAPKPTTPAAAQKSTPTKPRADKKSSPSTEARPKAVASAEAARNTSVPEHRSELGLLHYLTRRDIAAETVRHPPVLTVEAMLPHLQHISGAVTKNLFLRDKQKRLYVLSALHDTEFQLKDVAAQVPGAKELRFGDEAALWELLGVRSGCVTALALINDRAGKVRLLLDRRLVDGTYPKVWFHPLSNEATTGISPDDLTRFLTAIDHQPILLKL